MFDSSAPEPPGLCKFVMTFPRKNEKNQSVISGTALR